MIRAILIMSSLAGAMVSTPRLRAADVGDAAALHARFVDYSDELCGNQPVRRVRLATPSSRRRVDGVEDEATIQHERSLKF